MNIDNVKPMQEESGITYESSIMVSITWGEKALQKSVVSGLLSIAHFNNWPSSESQPLCFDRKPPPVKCPDSISL